MLFILVVLHFELSRKDFTRLNLEKTKDLISINNIPFRNNR